MTGLGGSIRERFDSQKRNIKGLVKKYREEYPDIVRNYTLLMVLYWRDIDGFPVPDAFIERAEVGTLTNPSSVLRAFRKVKKRYQTMEEKRRVSHLEQEWRRVGAEEKSLDDFINEVS